MYLCLLVTGVGTPAAIAEAEDLKAIWSFVRHSADEKNCHLEPFGEAVSQGGSEGASLQHQDICQPLHDALGSCLYKHSVSQPHPHRSAWESIRHEILVPVCLTNQQATCYRDTLTKHYECLTDQRQIKNQPQMRAAHLKQIFMELLKV